jgi:starvation-inducible outer membrane lipoprotein
MALYFFHMQTDTRFSDQEGTEFASPVEARAQAIITCGEMMRDAANGFWGTRPWTVNVTDSQGLTLWELSMDGFSSPAGNALG